jgi:hypothetical protein
MIVAAEQTILKLLANSSSGPILAAIAAKSNNKIIGGSGLSGGKS